MTKKGLGLSEPTLPTSLLLQLVTYTPALSVEATFSPQVGSSLLEQNSSFVLPHNVSIDDDQASAHRTSYVQKCRMKTHLG